MNVGQQSQLPAFLSIIRHSHTTHGGGVLRRTVLILVSRGAWAGRRHPLQASCRRHGRGAVIPKGRRQLQEELLV